MPKEVMLNLPYVSLPDYYTQLLSIEIQASSQVNLKLERFIAEHPEMSALIKRIFRDVDPEGYVGNILAKVGWVGIRNRLACAYLERELTGKYPEVVNLNLIHEVIELDNSLKSYSANGFQRGFLIGFYAKMTAINLKKIQDKAEFSPLLIGQKVLDLMSFSKGRQERVDWLFLQLVHYESYLGLTRLKSLLEIGSNYDGLYQLLSASEQNQMMQNYINYGSSINDSTMFVKNINGE